MVDNFRDFLLQVSSEKSFYLKAKNVLSLAEERQNDSVASPESAPLPLNWAAYMYPCWTEYQYMYSSHTNY